MNPIHIKKSHIGKLHSDLGIKQGEKIPHSTLVSALGKTSSPAIKKRINFALSAAKWGR